MSEQPAFPVSDAEAKTLAYADPPYPGRARRYYRTHPDYGGEVDHAELLERLDEYDGWAISTSMHTLDIVLASCASTPRIAVWHKPNAMYPGGQPGPWHVWEPVVYKSARPVARGLQDLLTYADGPNDRAGMLVGQKPRAFCDWMFRLIGARPTDSFRDLFPGSGAVTRAWDSWCARPALFEEVA